MQARCSCLVALLLVAAGWPATAQQSTCAPVSSNPLVMEALCSDKPGLRVLPAKQMSATTAAQSVLALTAEEIDRARLHDAPAIRMGDLLLFEANRRDFIFEILLSNGSELVFGPWTQTEAKDAVANWGKVQGRLDYPETLGQSIVSMKITPIHPEGPPPLLRGIKIDHLGEYVFELERARPTTATQTMEPSMSYPQDPRVMPASITRPNPFRPEPQTGFLAPGLPALSLRPMMFQASGMTDGNHYKYTGKEFDDETGLYYYGARYYSPGMGRFTSSDPTIFSKQRLFDPQQWNMFAYARNNPLKYTDPDGKELRLATGMSKADEQRVTKSLVEVYRKPGGAQRIEGLARSDIKYTVGSGDLKGEGYGLTRAEGKIDPETGKVDRSKTSVSITVDLQQKDKDQIDFEEGKRNAAPPSEENTMTEEIVHADIFDRDPDAQRGKSLDEKEKDAKPGIEEIGKQKKGDHTKASKRVNEILHPDKKKPEN